MDVAGRYLDATLGVDHHYTSAQVADMMFLVVGTIGIENGMAGSRSGCASAAGSFGPRGNVIPGLLE